MKVLHVIPSLSPKDGGPSFAMPLIARGLKLAGVEADIATTVGKDEPRITHDGLSVFSFPRQTERYKVSLELSRWLSARVADYDLVHIHAVFSYASYSAARVAIKRQVPYIVRPLGVLNRWGMENRRRLLKRLSFQLIERRILESAAAVHYTSKQERREAEQSGFRSNAAVIPLGIDVSAFRSLPSASRFLEKFPRARDRNVILFLSRLDPKKGLPLLLGAFAEVHRRNPPALLVIAGDGDRQFVDGLRTSAVQLGIAGDVVWTGFLAGDDKLSAMAAASMFVLPSHSENFGVALAEAMAAGLPCVLSDQIGLAEDVIEHQAGLVVPCEIAPLGAAMSRVIDDTDLRHRLSANARALAGSRYSLEGMAESLLKLYQRTLIDRAEQSRQSIALLGESGIHIK